MRSLHNIYGWGRRSWKGQRDEHFWEEEEIEEEGQAVSRQIYMPVREMARAA
jgi:hypothetical protein